MDMMCFNRCFRIVGIVKVFDINERQLAQKILSILFILSKNI
jgi:hypothetical protein